MVRVGSVSRLMIAATAVLLTALTMATGAMAAGPVKFVPKPANCQNTSGPFEAWLAAFRREAAQRGVRQQTLSLALDGLQMDPNIIRIDRGQSFFAQTFLDFQAKLATQNRVTNGRQQMSRHAGTFQRAGEQWGVPPAVITAFWALESDFGAGMGNRPVLKSLATLAWDCRRGEMFREELMAALMIIDRGDLTPSEMNSSWAGELGQTQFLPTHYLRHAVDFDGDGKRNLFKSPQDIIASTSAFIVSLGWQKGQPWLEEVRVPDRMAFEQAGLDIRHPRSYWVKQGVTKVTGQPLASDDLPASLILLQGKGGPAFLAYPNFKIFTEWNQSLNYATTAAYLATRLEGAPALQRGPSPSVLPTPEQMKELQTLLKSAGLYAGEIDGRLGLGTRTAIRQAQVRAGIPADSYPSVELIERLRTRR
ncbi:MAG: lytic murein transglycosylase [Hyphomicrobiales bacterium]|nr:lytic murein transglycosylase [Hyphomicrobiales bacterium]